MTIKKIIFLILLFSVLFMSSMVRTSQSTEWYLQAISYENTSNSPSARNVTIALIDSGVNTNNSYLWTNPNEKLNGIDDDNNGYIDDIHGWNFVTDTNDISDTNDHGTIMASIVTTLTTHVAIMPLVVLDAQNNLTSTNALIKALQYAIDKQVDIICIAIYFTNLTQTEIDLFTQAINDHIVVITSSGNYGTCPCNVNIVNALAQIHGVVTVGATDKNNQRLGLSQYGPGIDLMAPGDNITIDGLPSSGTSLATAFVTGADAIVQSFTLNHTRSV